MRISDFRQKEVINVSDGRRLGFVYDAEICVESGNIESLIIPGGSRIMGMFGRDNDYIIPWENIKRFGDDIILVELDRRMLRKFGIEG